MDNFNQARSQDVKFGSAKLFLEGQLPTQTENANTNTKKTWYNVMQKYVKNGQQNNIFQKSIESFCLIGNKWAY